MFLVKVGQFVTNEKCQCRFASGAKRLADVKGLVFDINGMLRWPKCSYTPGLRPCLYARPLLTDVTDRLGYLVVYLSDSKRIELSIDLICQEQETDPENGPHVLELYTPIFKKVISLY